MRERSINEKLSWRKMDLVNVRHGFDLSLGEVGVTIRKGEKWSMVPVGTRLNLILCTAENARMCDHSPSAVCSTQGEGLTLGFWVGRYAELPLGLLAIEHNVGARDKETLDALMQQAYGYMDENTKITALLYLRTAITGSN